MWAEVNGEKKKVACGPCIRGHRSSKCDHRDRVLVEVRKPGRPLSACPHPTGSCSCERVVINYTIPKTSECGCPSGRAPAASQVGTSSRVQKARSRKSTNTFLPSSLEKAIKANQDAETDASSRQTPTNPSLASASNSASPPSSASSTPRLNASPPRKQSHASDFQLPDASTTNRGTRSRSGTIQSQTKQTVSSCCQPRRESTTPSQQPAGGCCGSKPKVTPSPAPVKKSCCSGSSQQMQTGGSQGFGGQINATSTLGGNQYGAQSPYSMISQGMANQYMPSQNANTPSSLGMSHPFGFETPIYNHVTPEHQQPPAMPMVPLHNGNHVGNHMDHNCRCGETCSCFGCAAHPHNATMQEYVRVMTHFMSTGGFGTALPPFYDLPTYPHQPGFGAEPAQNVPFSANMSTNFGTLPGEPLPYQVSADSLMGLPNTPAVPTTSWQQDSMTTSPPPNVTNNANTYSSHSQLQEKPLLLKTEEAASSPAFTDSPKTEKDEEAPTLSPSSYFWNEVVLPGCNDATGTCQCGDGCECVGCLTHGGHNGITLDTPVTAGESSFGPYVLNNDSFDQAGFLPNAFSEAPT